jgi:uncharacterized protein (TIGR03067 family)
MRYALVLILIPAGLLAEDKKPDPAADVAALKGKWKIVSAQFNGNDSGQAGQRTLEFTEKDFTAFDGKKKVRTLNYSLDPSVRPPRMDFTRAGTDVKSLGIYHLDGDDLKICYGEPGADRPERIESKAGEKNFLLILKRVKPLPAAE